MLFCYFSLEEVKQSEAGDQQNISFHIERLQAPELLYQPSIIGLDQVIVVVIVMVMVMVMVMVIGIVIILVAVILVVFVITNPKTINWHQKQQKQQKQQKAGLIDTIHRILKRIPEDQQQQIVEVCLFFQLLKHNK